jgi:ferredoxin
MKISIDASLCMAYGLCIEEAPELFEISTETGQARVMEAALTADLITKARSAADVCPQRAVLIAENEA